MCRNITILRGLEPPATPEEVEAAARQFVRKVTGITTASAATRDPFEAAVADVAGVVTELLARLPERRRPPSTVPPLRRPTHQHGAPGAHADRAEPADHHHAPAPARS